MKIKLTKDQIIEFVYGAEQGNLGHETEIDGDNSKVDMTILAGDIDGHPELRGGTVRVYLNKKHRYIGHTVIAPRRK